MSFKLTSSTQRRAESNQTEWFNQSPFCGFNDLSIWRPVERWITTITYLIKKKIFSSVRPEWWIEFHSTWLTTLIESKSDWRRACSAFKGVSRLIPKRFESFLWTACFFFFLFLVFLFFPQTEVDVCKSFYSYLHLSEPTFSFSFDYFDVTAH